MVCSDLGARFTASQVVFRLASNEEILFFSFQIIYHFIISTLDEYLVRVPNRGI